MEGQSRIRVLLLDEDDSFGAAIAAALQVHGLDVVLADRSLEARRPAGEPFRVVVMELRVGEVEGLDLLRLARATCPGAEVIVLTAHPSMGSAVECVREGVFDYLIKPQSAETLAARIQQAARYRRSTLPTVVPR